MKRHSIEMTHQPVHCSAGHDIKLGTKYFPSPVVSPGQPLQDLPELLPPPRLCLLAGEDEVRVEVVRDQRGRQEPEVKLEHRTGQEVDTSDRRQRERRKL